MKIDFHTHGKLAKKLYFSKEFTKRMFKKAKKRVTLVLYIKSLLKQIDTLGGDYVKAVLKG